MYPLLWGRVEEEDGEVDCLDDDADAVDGDDEEAVGVDDGETVEQPEQAVHERRQVGVRRELLHILVLADPVKCLPACAMQKENKLRFMSWLPTATFHIQITRQEEERRAA
jgi:hypothetical protein